MCLPLRGARWRGLPRREDDAEVAEGVPRPRGEHVVRGGELPPPRVCKEEARSHGRDRDAGLREARSERESDARADEVVEEEGVGVHVLSRLLLAAAVASEEDGRGAGVHSRLPAGMPPIAGDPCSKGEGGGDEGEVVGEVLVRHVSLTHCLSSPHLSKKKGRPHAP